MTQKKFRLVAGLATYWCAIPVIQAQNQPPQPSSVQFKIQEYESTFFGESAPLRDIGPQGKPQGNPNRPLLRPGILRSDKLVADPAAQTSAPVVSTAAAGLGFEGVQDTRVAPSDANLAVGPNHIVQMVNVQYAVFDKLGTLLLGPLSINAIFAGHGLCETLPSSDPIARYDQLADRWLLSYVAFDFNAFDFHECTAVSASPDPTGAYYLYDWDFNYRLQDYPKFGVWPDGYYMAANSFLFGFSFEGANLCAFERSKMLSGARAKGICVLTNQFFVGQLPSDLDGPALPPPNSPNYFVGLYTYNPGNLAMFRFVPNYANTGASSVTGPFFIPTSSFNLPCSNGGDCIPQPGTTQLLASLGDRAMYRLAYRNLGDHESLVLNHTVQSQSGIMGIRWYELRNPNTTPFVFQEGTYVPDSDYRWMGSIAMDRSGNIGLGYSKSGPELHPGIYYTGREAGDPAGVLQAEQEILAGGGSQLDINRWGDYTALELDPSDDCTFWYTNQYLPVDASFSTETGWSPDGWHTRIASFRFESCGVSPPPGNTAPAVTIDAPLDESTYTDQVLITFSGTATDAEDGTLTQNLIWTSSIDGQIGSGGSFSRTLSAGTHLITASVTDSGGLSGSDSVTVTVSAAPPPTTVPTAPSNLTATAIYSGAGKNKIFQMVTLGWSDNSNDETGFVIQRCTLEGKGKTQTCNFGDLATAAANQTFYTDAPSATNPMPPGTYRYQVAAINGAGRSGYSNTAQVNVR